jgi:hypothetical protein
MKHKNNTIFVLKAFFICPIYDKTKDEWTLLPPTYPTYNIQGEYTGFYSTIENAKAGMKRRIEKLKEEEKEGLSICHYGNLYCFWIEEVKFDRETISEWCYEWKWNYRLTAETRRAYLPDGSLWAENLTSETAVENWHNATGDTREELQRQGAFVGRRPDEIRFQIGDIVEVMGIEKIDLGIVIRTPLTLEDVERSREKYVRYNPGKKPPVGWWDYSDDIYLVLMGEVAYNFKGSDDVDYPYDIFDLNSYPVEVFEPRFPVPDNLAEALKRACDYWQLPEEEILRLQAERRARLNANPLDNRNK